MGWGFRLGASAWNHGDTSPLADGSRSSVLVSNEDPCYSSQARTGRRATCGLMAPSVPAGSPRQEADASRGRNE